MSQRPKIPHDILVAANERGWKLEVDWACAASPAFRRKVCKEESGAKSEDVGSDYYRSRAPSCLNCKQNLKFVLKVRTPYGRPTMIPFHATDAEWFFKDFQKNNLSSNPMSRLNEAFRRTMAEADKEDDRYQAITDDYQTDLRGRVARRLAGQEFIDYGRSNCL